MHRFRRIQSVWDRVSGEANRVTCWVCIALIIFMTAEVLLHVFFRYALEAPLQWGEELARLAMVWAGLLGISIALREGEHLGIEALVSQLSGKALLLCNLVSHILIGLFLLVVLIWGTSITLESRVSFLPALQISWAWSILAVPVSAAVQLIQLISLLLNDVVSFTQLREGKAT
jgi:TRAP-type C4-dicarboxylate transport system permease small subunit